MFLSRSVPHTRRHASIMNLCREHGTSPYHDLKPGWFSSPDVQARIGICRVEDLTLMIRYRLVRPQKQFPGALSHAAILCTDHEGRTFGANFSSQTGIGRASSEC